MQQLPDIKLYNVWEERLEKITLKLSESNREVINKISSDPHPCEPELSILV